MNYTSASDIINFTPEEFWRWIARTSPDRQSKVKVTDPQLLIARAKKRERPPLSAARVLRGDAQ